MAVPIDTLLRVPMFHALHSLGLALECAPGQQGAGVLVLLSLSVHNAKRELSACFHRHATLLLLGATKTVDAYHRTAQSPRIWSRGGTNEEVQGR